MRMSIEQIRESGWYNFFIDNTIIMIAPDITFLRLREAVLEQKKLPPVHSGIIYDPVIPTGVSHALDYLRGTEVIPRWKDELHHMYIHPYGDECDVRAEDLTPSHLRTPLPDDEAYMYYSGGGMFDPEWHILIKDDEGRIVFKIWKNDYNEIRSFIEKNKSRAIYERLAPRCQIPGCNQFVFAEEVEYLIKESRGVTKDVCGMHLVHPQGRTGAPYSTYTYTPVVVREENRVFVGLQMTLHGPFGEPDLFRIDVPDIGIMDVRLEDLKGAI